MSKQTKATRCVKVWSYCGSAEALCENCAVDVELLRKEYEGQHPYLVTITVIEDPARRRARRTK